MYLKKHKTQFNIRTRLSLQFTLIVAIILLLLLSGVYFFSSNYRKAEFYSRLKNKALTTARFLIEVKEIDVSLLKIIDRNTLNVLHDEKIVIYDYRNEEIYSSIDDSNIPVSREMLNTIRLQKEIQFHYDEKEVIGILYTDKYNRYVVIASAFDEYGLSKLDNLKTILVSGFLFSVIAALFAGWIYSGKALKPMKNVVAQVDKITISNLDLRVNEGNGTDEIAQLAITFNRMLERLERAFEMQRSFVSNASHELRTPLTAITGQIEVCLMKKRDRQEYENILQSVFEDIRMLSRLSNNLLDLAKASSDVSEIKLRTLRIDELLWQVQGELKKRNSDYNVHIVFDEAIDDENKLILFGNEHLLKSALLNLMDNACKFSDNESVHVSLEVQDGQVKLNFADGGIGIDANEQEQVFHPFYRASNARNINGHGLGLSLTKKIVEIHKGVIKIESALAKGTCVAISFPIHGAKI